MRSTGKGGLSPMRGDTRAADSPVPLQNVISADAASGWDGSSTETQVLTYHDQDAGFEGYLALDGQDNPLAAGGFRVQPGLTADTTARLAQLMTLKQRLLGLGVDGAKCGIAYDPRSPGKRAAMRRFLRFVRPYLLSRFSMGPDMGTTWREIESVARAEGIPSAKIAIGRAQGLPDAEVLRRLQLLDADVDGRTLGQRRAGHGLAHAALAASPVGVEARLRVGVQGFGTLGRAAAQSLAEAGARIVTVADEFGALVDPDGLDVARLLATGHHHPLAVAAPRRRTHRDAVFDAPVDLLVLAACEDAMSSEQARALPDTVHAVAVGANLGLTPQAEELLAARGVAVVPDFVGGCGGSASMDALFGPPVCPTPAEFLDRLAATMRAAVRSVLDRAATTGLTPRAAALALCAEEPPRRRRPYGS